MPTVVNQLGISTTDQVIFSQSSQPVVEPLGGNISLNDIMKRFPDEIYAQGPDTRLYKFIQALCGDSGAGILKAQSLAIRLKNEGPLLVFHDLDTFYSHTFNFPRIRREIYNYDAASQTLLDTSYDPTNIAVEKEVWDKIHAADDSYRRRVLDFMSATRYGGSPKGIQLAARAGSGEEVDVVENYQWVFDQFSDDPFGLEHLGDTLGTGEFIVMPAGTSNTNDNVEANILTLTFAPGVTSGTFTISYESTVSAAITFTDNTDISNAIYLGILGISSGTLFGLTDVTVVVDTANTNVYTITVNDPQLDALFFGIDSTSLVGGVGTITYPLGDSYYMVNFNYPLASFYEDNLAEITGGSLNVDHPVTDSAFYADNVAAGPTVHLTPDIEYNMIRTLDHLRPVSTVMTVHPKRSSQIQVAVNEAFASSENFTLIRWVTGNPSVAWPPLDAERGTFIQGIATSDSTGATANVENESTSFAFGSHLFPTLFQTINTILAYTEDALQDSTYNTVDFSARYALYKSEHQGRFDALITQLFPFLLHAVSDSDKFLVGLAVPGEPAPLLLHYPFVIL